MNSNHTSSTPAQGTDYRVRMLLENTHPEMRLGPIVEYALRPHSFVVRIFQRNGSLTGDAWGNNHMEAIENALRSYDQKGAK